MSTTTETDRRTSFTDGLRALADILDENPDVPLPYEGTGCAISWGVHGTAIPDGKDVPRAVADLARIVIPGKRAKDVAIDGYYRLRGHLHGLAVEVWAMRNDVCERVVIGSETVTREVPDPEALAAVPTTTVTETVEKVEWRCTPLLAGTEQLPVAR